MCPTKRPLLMAALLLGAGRGVEGKHRLFDDTKAAKSSSGKSSKSKSKTSSKVGKAFDGSGSSAKAFKTSKQDDAPLQPPIVSTLRPIFAPVATSTPTTSPSDASAPAGTPSSICPLPEPAPTTPTSCEPTTGPCIADEANLASVTNSMDDYDVISLCGEIETESTIRIEASNATVCCASRPCRVAHSSTSLPHQLMYITGENFTLSGIDFEGGQGNSSVPGGGNLAIVADGSHLIENSVFRNGTAPSHRMRPPNIGWTSGCGGNVFVGTNHTLTVRRSTFSSGFSGTSSYGGGLCVYDAAWLSIENSVFTDNESGGFMTHWTGPRYSLPDQDGQHISIFNSTFEGNTDEAVFVSTYGKMSSLRIHQTAFVENKRGVSVCCGFDDVVLCDNEGASEESLWCEHSIFVYGSNSSEICVPLDKDFPDF